MNAFRGGGGWGVGGGFKELLTFIDSKINSGHCFELKLLTMIKTSHCKFFSATTN